MSEGAASRTELMIVAAARALRGVRTVFVGVGLPNIAANLARRTVAPDLELIYESGVYGARPARQPLSVGDPTLASGAAAVMSMADLFGFYLQGGLIEVALLGGAQIDRTGSLNSTVIGDYTRPTVRLPGSGGACEIAANAGRVITIMHLKRRAFVERLDFCTSPGHPRDGRSRAELGLPGAGPSLVVTDRAIFDFNGAGQQMRLVEIQPGVTIEEARAEVGWELEVAPAVETTPLPSDDELHLARAALR